MAARPRALRMKLPAPYAQCLSSRRFMLSLEPKSVPSTALIVSMAGSSGLDFGGATLPAMITDWSEPGRSNRYTAE